MSVGQGAALRLRSPRAPSRTIAPQRSFGLASRGRRSAWRGRGSGASRGTTRGTRREGSHRRGEPTARGTSDAPRARHRGEDVPQCSGSNGRTSGRRCRLPWRSARRSRRRAPAPRSAAGRRARSAAPPGPVAAPRPPGSRLIPRPPSPPSYGHRDGVTSIDWHGVPRSRRQTTGTDLRGEGRDAGLGSDQEADQALASEVRSSRRSRCSPPPPPDARRELGGRADG